MSTDATRSAENHVKAFLAALPGEVPRDLPIVAGDPVEEWAASGLMELTGPEDGPAVEVATPIIARARSILVGFEVLAGATTGLDAADLLTERAAIAGLSRRGPVTPGGAGRMLPAVDGAIALSLPRQTDWDLATAWLEQPVDDWEAIAELTRDRSTVELGDRARTLGLPYAAAGARVLGPPARAVRLGQASARPIEGMRVVDLSAMWAGPLCGRLLAAIGADVVKVESPARPDGMRSGTPELWARLNRDKTDRTAEWDAAALSALIAGADAVIESARPRVMEQLGIDVEAVVAAGTTWVSITGHGRWLAPDRVAFGDDAAVAGGAFVTTTGLPWFVGDALADPLTGIHAATALAAVTIAGGSWLVDVPMSGVVGSVVGREGIELAD